MLNRETNGFRDPQFSRNAHFDEKIHLSVSTQVVHRLSDKLVWISLNNVCVARE